MPERYERLYRMLLDSIPSSVLLLDPLGRVVSANHNFLTKARLSATQVIGQPLEKAFPAVIYQYLNLRQRVADVFRSGEPVQGERLTYRAPGLSARTYYYSLIPFNWDGRIENVLLLMEDITDKVRLGEEARRAERHLASVVESASDLVVSMDLDGRVLTWNTAATQVTGYAEGAVRQRRLSDLCVPAQRPAFAEFLATVAQVEPTAPFEVELLHTDGTTRALAWVCAPMRDTDGRAVGLVAVGRDLTERRKLEAKLVQSEKLAALGVMAGGIAHEIRNPLAVVSGAAQLLLDAQLSADVQRECAERIHRNVHRAADVIEGLLRFARPSNQGTKRPLDLGKTVQEAAELVLNQLRLARAELRVQVPTEPTPLRGHAGLLQQMVTNLLLNAANALPDDGGLVELRLSNDPLSTPHSSLPTLHSLVLQVQDNGRGIAATDLAKVFDPFFTTMPVGRGTGLGLSICYAIAQQHEATIDISSTPGQGTTVTVRFPAEART
jgi:PAS domain S-box-containing protein